MGIYEEQIRGRLKNDEERFQEAFAGMVGAVMGKKITEAMNNERQVAKNAIDEILKYYGFQTRELPIEIEDINEMLEYQLRPSGSMHSTVHLEKGWRNSAVGPMIGMKKTGGVVAFLPSLLFGYRCYDRGVWKKVTRASEAQFEDEAICFYRPLPRERVTPGKLLRFCLEAVSRSEFLLIVGVTAVFTILGMLLPLLSNFMIAEVIPGNSFSLFVSTAIFFLCITLAIPLIKSVNRLLISRVSSKINMAATSAVYMRLLNLPLSFFREYSPGELSSRLQRIGDLCTLLTSAVLTHALTAAFSLAYVVQIFTFAPALVLPTLAVIFAGAIFSGMTAVAKIRQMDRQLEYQVKSSGLEFGLMSGIQKIKAAGAEKRAFAQWADSYTKVEEIYNRPGPLLRYRQVVSSAILLLGTLWIYAAAIKSGVSVSEYYAFCTAYGMVSAAFLQLSDVSFLLAQVKPVLRMVGPILEETPGEQQNKEMVRRLNGSIELNHVSFQYSSDMPLILDDLSLKINRGEYVAIVGNTGCGKSTLMRIMLGLEAPQKGAVYYDRRNIADFDLRMLRRRVGVVNQNGDLFAGTIFSNIAICAPHLTEEEAWEAAEMSGSAEDIRSMPLGMYTHVASGSGGLSGGQRQRIMIARAIAPKPGILMLDEATSALDNITQKQVADTMRKLDCTRIVIAHRLSTIRECDRIVVLDRGHIVEDGSYDELMAADGFFAKLVERQQLEGQKNS